MDDRGRVEKVAGSMQGTILTDVQTFRNRADLIELELLLDFSPLVDTPRVNRDGRGGRVYSL